MIKNLIFDVGEVLLEYRWKDLLMEYGISGEEAERIAWELFQEDIWVRKMDMGEMTLREAAVAFRERFPEDGDVMEWFLQHGKKMAVPRPEVWEKVVRLKQAGYGIYLLSNYSEELFRMHTEGASFLDALDGGVISYQIHQIKPQEGIYRALLENYGLTAQECLFFDDRVENVEAARRMGMQAWQIHSRAEINEILEEILRKSDGKESGEEEI